MSAFGSETCGRSKIIARCESIGWAALDVSMPQQDRSTWDAAGCPTGCLTLGARRPTFVPGDHDPSLRPNCLQAGRPKTSMTKAIGMRKRNMHQKCMDRIKKCIM